MKFLANGFRWCSGYVGIFCTTIGTLSFIFHDAELEEFISKQGAIVLTLFGVLLMYIGRKYLTVLTAIFLSGSDDDN